ncbi:MAG: hypothetical protein JNL73_13875 [Anaerolineales bacterium]|nr:hypothetical protein [Anaerolineales bacterium]
MSDPDEIDLHTQMHIDQIARALKGKRRVSIKLLATAGILGFVIVAPPGLVSHEVKVLLEFTSGAIGLYRMWRALAPHFMPRANKRGEQVGGGPTLPPVVTPDVLRNADRINERRYRRFIGIDPTEKP